MEILPVDCHTRRLTSTQAKWAAFCEHLLSRWLRDPWELAEESLVFALSATEWQLQGYFPFRLVSRLSPVACALPVKQDTSREAGKSDKIASGAFSLIAAEPHERKVLSFRPGIEPSLYISLSSGFHLWPVIPAKSLDEVIHD